MGRYYQCMLVDPSNNYNNHDAVLIDRCLYRANAALQKLENGVLEKLAEIKDALGKADDAYPRADTALQAQEIIRALIAKDTP